MQLLKLLPLTTVHLNGLLLLLQRRYHGCQAGRVERARLTARAANRRRVKPSIPSVIMGNTNSLPNKLDELTALCRTEQRYRETSLFVFSEMLLTGDVPDAKVGLNGFSSVRADRDTNTTGDKKGGGLIIYTNDRWCHPGHVTVKSTLCNRDLEPAAVSIRPYYLAREFSHVIVLAVYIPPRADPETARETICGTTSALRTRHPEALVIITGGKSFGVHHSVSNRNRMFEFSESFSSYFFNKGLIPLGGVCSDEDVDENYVPMSAATTEPPSAPRPSPSSDSSLQQPKYVPMTPVTSRLPSDPTPTTADLTSPGRPVPQPAHTGFRNTPVSLATPKTPLVRGDFMTTEATRPPVHRNLKPRNTVTPIPLEDWQEVPPPVRSPVTRTFTRQPSSCGSIQVTSDHSSSPSSDSDDPDEGYIAMTTSNLSFSTREESLRLTLHRASECGARSSPLLRRSRTDKQVEYLDLDLHAGRLTSRQSRPLADEGGGSDEMGGAAEERAGGGRSHVDYVVVDPERTRALRNTIEAWHDGRTSREGQTLD
ncbi:uncharacterized protein [Antennarius striatus]|uniref:uncharacterized protein isoform X6 n=1 Tax=Antennarius striatus TaxID=241820 RepID=UPI0035B2E43F